MKLLKAASIAKFAYSNLPFPSGVARIQIKGKEVKYNYKFIEKNNTQAYILENDKELIVSIRGSKQLADVKDVFTVKKVFFEGVGLVHQGFLEGFYDLFDEVEKIINETDKQVYFIGHSLGGAVAKLLGLYYRYNHVTTITFGEPKGCCDRICSGNSEFIRISNNMDMIPRIHLRYNHGVIKKEENHIYIKKNGKIVRNPSAYREFIDVMGNSLLKLFSVFIFIEMVNDHLMDSHINLLS